MYALGPSVIQSFKQLFHYLRDIKLRNLLRFRHDTRAFVQAERFKTRYRRLFMSQYFADNKMLVVLRSQLVAILGCIMAVIFWLPSLLKVSVFASSGI